MAVTRYAIFNNKGGVGKTFITFVVASEYARLNPKKNVIVVDMCPQANVSEILLGGNGTGAQSLQKLLALSPRRTIGGYFDLRVKSPHSISGINSQQFLTHLNGYNGSIPSNMYLVAGDPSLEVQAQAMNQIAAQTLPTDAWRNVHLWLSDLIGAISDKVANAAFFIDCNPSFAAYTELAVSAASRLIVPCTADGSSARAIDNVGRLLFGIGMPSSYKGASFASKARAAGIGLPKIHVVPLNRSTQYDKKASKAFGAMYDEVKRRVAGLQAKRKSAFTNPDPFLEIPDAHSVSVVASHQGRPLSALSPGAYDVHGVTTQVNADPLSRYKQAVHDMVKGL